MLTSNDSLMTSVSEMIISDILSGKLKPGSTLSSKRQLANKYSVSRTVIDRALDYLVEMGYIIRDDQNEYQVIDFDRFKDFNDLTNFFKFEDQQFSDDDITHIKHLKAGLDALSIKLLKLPISEEDANSMKKIISSINCSCAYCKNKTCDHCASIVYDLYTKLAQMSQNKFLPWLYYAFTNTNIKIISSYIKNVGIETIYNKGCLIIDYLREGKREKAIKVIDSNLD